MKALILTLIISTIISLSTPMDSSTTFRVSNKIPEFIGEDLFYGQSEDGKALESIPDTLPNYRGNNCTELLQASEFSPRTRIAYNNGFVNTVVDSYNKHHNLAIRPDDIWAAIMIQFSTYVNANAEEFRGKFVNFEGKKKLTVTVPGSLRNARYDQIVQLMGQEIDRNLVDSEVKSWLLPNFSTTNENDLISSGVVFMASMKKYFDFETFLLCGIPFVTLEGTLADWEDIVLRLEKLREYGLEKWYWMLRPILAEFVEAKKRRINVRFWQRIVNFHEGGSGPDYISGWITAFCVFDKDGRWQGETSQLLPKKADRSWPVIKTKNIPPGVVEVDLTINDNGSVYNSSMFAGHMAVEIQEDFKTLKPKIGWVICLKAPQPRNSPTTESEFIFSF